MGHSPSTADANELIKLSSHVYGDSTAVPAGWSVIDSRSDPLSGLRGIVYQNVLDPSRIAVAIAGTQFTNGGTLDTDGAILGDNFPQRFNDELRALLDSIIREQPKDVQIAITGHSLGGSGVHLAVPYLIDQGFINVYGLTSGALGASNLAGRAGFDLPLLSYARDILHL